jgi:hypothetical protein
VSSVETLHEPGECHEWHDVVADYVKGPYPEIIAVLGGTLNPDKVQQVINRLTLENSIVLDLGVYQTVLTTGQVASLRELMKRKIDLADSVCVVGNPVASQDVIDYAESLNKPVHYLEFT